MYLAYIEKNDKPFSLLNLYKNIIYYVCNVLTVLLKKEFVELYLKLGQNIRSMDPSKLDYLLLKYYYVEIISFDIPLVYTGVSVSRKHEFTAPSGSHVIKCSDLHKSRIMFKSRANDLSFLFTYKTLEGIVTNIIKLLTPKASDVNYVLIIGCKEPLNILIIAAGVKRQIECVEFHVVERNQDHAIALEDLAKMTNMAETVKVFKIDFNFFKAVNRYCLAMSFVYAEGLKMAFALKLIFLCKDGTEILGSRDLYVIARDCNACTGRVASVSTKRLNVKCKM